MQAIPSSCIRSPCNVTTVAEGLGWPLGIVSVDDDTVMVSLDWNITALSPDGSRQRLLAAQGDCGYLTLAERGHGDEILAAGGDILSFDAACQGPECTPSVVWRATQGIKAYGAIAHLRSP